MMEPCYASLDSLQWTRLKFRIRNERNTFSRQHPLFVAKAILLSGKPPPVGRDKRGWRFLPMERTGDRVEKGRIYEFAVYYKTPDLEYAEIHLQRLRSHLSQSKNNFSWIDDAVIEHRSFSDLTLESSRLMEAESSADLGLDFLSPMSFHPGDNQPKHRLLAADLGHYCRKLVANWFGFEINDSHLWKNLSTLWWFWAYEEHKHLSKSHLEKGKTSFQWLRGASGPLFLRGPWRSVLPMFLLASELGIGERNDAGEGKFNLSTDLPGADALLTSSGHFSTAWERLRAKSDLAEEIAHVLVDPEKIGAGLIDKLRADQYQSQPAQAFGIPKSDGGTRRLNKLQPHDWILHRAVLDAVQPFTEDYIPVSAVGFRPDQSVNTAKQKVTEAIHEGCTHALQSDIAQFFDAIPWNRLDIAVDHFLPRSDVLIRRALKQAIRLPVLDGGRIAEREQGVPTGSPLSPILANLVLKEFDESMIQRGHRMIRYADDLLIPCRSLEDAERALSDVTDLLARIPLNVHPEKTSIVRLDEGVRYLGQDLDLGLMVELAGKLSLRKPVYIRRFGAFVGVDGDSLIVRSDGELIARLPIHRISDIYLWGAGSISTYLVEKCAEEEISMIVCSPGGRPAATLTPATKAAATSSGLHYMRFSKLSIEEKIQAAAQIVMAKVANHRAWLSTIPGAHVRRVVESLSTTLQQVPRVTTLDEVRGLEGNCAREVFSCIGTMAKDPAFHSLYRLKRAHGDLLNTLLDFGYMQLFHRLHGRMIAKGLNPWLGFLHSDANPYASLVCDLQEPFRCRVDRWVLKMIHQGRVVPSHFHHTARHGWQLTSEAVPVLLDGFAEEENRVWAGDPGTWSELMTAQVVLLSDWACRGADLRIFRSQP